MYLNTVLIPKGTPGNANTRGRTDGRERDAEAKRTLCGTDPASSGLERTPEAIPAPLPWQVGRQRQ